MGCSCSKEEAKKYISNELNNYMNPYIIKINIPKTDKLKLIIYEGKSEEMLLADIINSAFFSNEYAEDIDANFISIYDSEAGEYHYYIQRLIGYEIDEENPQRDKVWTCYINRQKYDWSHLCNYNRVLRKGDEVEFRFERV
jgi:hypothetical protein